MRVDNELLQSTRGNKETVPVTASDEDSHTLKDGWKSSMIIKADAIIVTDGRQKRSHVWLPPFFPCLAHWVSFLEKHKMPRRLSGEIAFNELHFNEEMPLWCVTDLLSNYNRIQESTMEQLGFYPTTYLRFYIHGRETRLCYEKVQIQWSKKNNNKFLCKVQHCYSAVCQNILSFYVYIDEKV